MGCAGSKHLVSSTGDNLLKSSAVVTALDSIPSNEGPLKDLPDVVEKVLDTLKETDHIHNSDSESLADEKDHSTMETKVVKTVRDIENKSPKQNLVQNLLPDNLSSTSKQSNNGSLNTPYKKESPTKSADIDSLRTSSPESEIEQALANSNDQNPPTPVPTFSELQQLAVNTIISSYVKISENSANQEDEKGPVIEEIDIVQKYESITITLKDPTEWEIQADLYASSQKSNPIEAARKLRKENGASPFIGLAQRERGEFKPKGQRYFEDLNEFLPLESPHRSRLSSAKSDRSSWAHLSDSDTNGKIYKNKTETVNGRLKGDDVKIKRTPTTPEVKRTPTTPEVKRKENTLTVSQNVKNVRGTTPSPSASPLKIRGIPSPIPFKVRQRCVVCYNKYNNNNNNNI